MSKAIGLNSLESLEIRDLYNFIKEFSLYEDIDEMIIYYKEYEEEDIAEKAFEVSKILTKASNIIHGFEFEDIELNDNEKLFIRIDNEKESVGAEIIDLLTILELLENMIVNGGVSSGIDCFIDKKVGERLFDSKNLWWVNEIKNPLFERTYEKIK